MHYVDAAGQGWKLQLVGGRAVLVERFVITHRVSQDTIEPRMVTREWRAPGLRYYVDESKATVDVHAARDGRLYIDRPFSPMYFAHPGKDGAEPISQTESPVKPPRGKWRWSSCGRWLSIAKR